MEPFVVSALKYRPQSFEDVVGQKTITDTLINAIKNDHLAQALLFTGPRGVGKTTCARILAKMINRSDDVTAEEDFAFNIFELDAASNNSVDDIRSLTDQVRIPPQIGKFKVYIIDEVHMLSTQAFNAFLKTLEEPPKHCIFILATTEKQKIIPTILSRCQIFDFKRITVEDAKKYLHGIANSQGIKAEDGALHLIAQKADGAMRDALSIFDRIVSFSGNNLTRSDVAQNLNILDYQTFFKSTDLILNHDIPSLLLQFDDLLSKGFDGHQFITGLASHFRDLLVAKTKETVNLIEVGEETKTKYLNQAESVEQQFLIIAIEKTNTCDLNYKNAKNQRLLVELCLMQLASILYGGEKKNPKNYIIPAEKFNSYHNKDSDKFATIHKEPKPKKLVNNLELDTTQKSKVADKTLAPPKIEKEVFEIPQINSIKKQQSGLSLSSIKRKKEHQIKLIDVNVSPENLPEEPFTQEQLSATWQVYVTNLEKEGRYNLASILQIDTPKLVGESTIKLEFPNSTNKLDVERQQYKLLQFIRKSLNNFSIQLEIEVNETLEQKYAYTSEDKFKKLATKNNYINLLRSTFDLEY